MKYGNLIIEKKEYLLLKRLLNLSGYNTDETFRKAVKIMIGELLSAKILDDAEMPNDVVRINSVITIGTMDGWQQTFQLVLPTESNLKAENISITTLMGTLIIGASVGDTLKSEFPSGVKELTILKVCQDKKHINLDMVL